MARRGSPYCTLSPRRSFMIHEFRCAKIFEGQPHQWAAGQGGEAQGHRDGLWGVKLVGLARRWWMESGWVLCRTWRESGAAGDLA